eukprot:Rhum_TRINITY_DN10913_c0_g1::Rhum_TRINITY_DN10913_c0_g1_i1::g.41223::m.41223
MLEKGDRRQRVRPWRRRLRLNNGVPLAVLACRRRGRQPVEGDHTVAQQPVVPVVELEHERRRLLTRLARRVHLLHVRRQPLLHRRDERLSLRRHLHQLQPQRLPDRQPPPLDAPLAPLRHPRRGGTVAAPHPAQQRGLLLLRHLHERRPLRVDLALVVVELELRRRTVRVQQLERLLRHAGGVVRRSVRRAAVSARPGRGDGGGGRLLSLDEELVAPAPVLLLGAGAGDAGEGTKTLGVDLVRVERLLDALRGGEVGAAAAHAHAGRVGVGPGHLLRGRFLLPEDDEVAVRVVADGLRHNGAAGLEVRKRHEAHLRPAHYVRGRVHHRAFAGPQEGTTGLRADGDGGVVRCRRTLFPLHEAQVVSFDLAHHDTAVLRGRRRSGGGGNGGSLHFPLLSLYSSRYKEEREGGGDVAAMKYRYCSFY